MAKAIKRLMAKSGTYNDRQTGQQKNSYTRCGVLMQGDDGEFSVKLEALPVNFDGWLNCWDLDGQKAQQQPQQAPQQGYQQAPQQQAPQQGFQQQPGYDDNNPSF